LQDKILGSLLDAIVAKKKIVRLLSSDYKFSPPPISFCGEISIRFQDFTLFWRGVFPVILFSRIELEK
jgi:hypothetical protein